MADKEVSTTTPSTRGSRGVFGDPFGNLFEGFFRPMTMLDGDAPQVPAVDVRETDDAYIVHAELPGMKKEDINVTAHDGVLTISAETKQESETKEDGRILRRERRYGSFRRDMRLGADIKAADVSAKYEDGVLVVTAPKTPEAPRHKIEVKVS